MKLNPQIHSVFKGLAHPRRVIIFEVLRLANRPLTYGEIQNRTRLSAQVLTHHLSELTKAKLVKRTPKGPKTFFRIKLTPLGMAAADVTQICNPTIPRAA